MEKVFYRFEPRIIRSRVPEGIPGVYLLACYENARLHVGYVGRSDHCLRQRLMTHDYLYRFDYFWFRPERNWYRAYLAESSLWHALKDEVKLLNKLHPATPELSKITCPICAALKQVRAYLHHNHNTA